MSTLPSSAGNVARLIDGSLRAISSRRSAKEIARLARITPVILSNVRRGHSKLPLEYVVKIAAALDIDPHRLLLVVLDEGMRPEARNVLVSLLGRLITDNEMAIVEVIRVASDGKDPVATKAIQRGLVALFGS